MFKQFGCAFGTWSLLLQTHSTTTVVIVKYLHTVHGDILSKTQDCLSFSALRHNPRVTRNPRFFKQFNIFWYFLLSK